MREFHLVSDAELARARADAPFRQKLLVESLDQLLSKLNRLRADVGNINAQRAQQMREGAKLAVKLADLLHAQADDQSDGATSV